MSLNVRRWLVVGCGLLLALCAGCNKGAEQQTRDYDGPDDAAGAAVKKNVTPQPDAQVAVLETDYGRIVIELYPNVAPQQVARFKQLAGEGFYNGTTFHRIDPDLGIIQGGDPNSKDNNPANDGTGSSPLPNLPAEFSDLPYERGTVGAARAQDVNSANCQFFITLKRQPMFDQRYTVFGKVIQGLNEADIISHAPLAEGTQDRPADKIVVKSVELENRKP
ncbi:MAG TPA: peptidylprolyl isomerase [Pyrinomonadaceae bacterium]